MLEEILKDINNNLKRIADAEERRVGIDMGVQNSAQTEASIIAQTNNANTVVASIPTEKVNLITENIAVPVANTVESFTQEQLALAMGNAVSAGKMGIVQNILAQFNVQALTQVKPEDYNRLATMLKEQGVEV